MQDCRVLSQYAQQTFYGHHKDTSPSPSNGEHSIVMSKPSVMPDGRAIKTKRLQLGLSQEELGSKAGISASLVKKLERGEPVFRTSVEAVATALHGSYNDFVAPYFQIIHSTESGHRSAKSFSIRFDSLLERFKSPMITAFNNCGYGDTIELQASPPGGWLIDTIRLTNDDASPFQIPEQYEDDYKAYYTRHYKEKRFYNDGDKFMLSYNPISFDEAPSLRLETRPTRYSVTNFYWDEISRRLDDRNCLIQECIAGSLRISFAHSLCLHIVAITSDRKLILTKRAPKTSYKLGGTWSCSFEEQLKREDIASSPDRVCLAWMRRAIKEELHIAPEVCHDMDMTLLSVFLETNGLNVSLCGFVDLPLSSAELDIHLRQRHGDQEFTEWTFIDLEVRALIRALFQPELPYHPTTGFRLLMTLLHRFGVPQDEDLDSLE